MRISDSGSRSFVGVFVVTLLAMVSVGAVLPVLPLYVTGPLGGGEVAVGIVIGAYAVTGLIGRPFAGRFADRRGRRPAVVVGSLLAACAGFLYLLPLGVPGLIFARLVHGAGEGAVFTAGSAWIVDLAPVDRRGRVIGLYGLAVWTGLSLGPPIGDILLRVSSFELVWVFAGLAPLAGALVAMRLPSGFGGTGDGEGARGSLIAREALRPGLALALGAVGFAAVASFLILHLEERGIGGGAGVFGAFAAMVVLTRLVGGNLPDRVGPVRCAVAATCVEALGLATMGLAQSLPVALAGALAMGAAFSVLYPALSLIVVQRVPESRRGSALGTFTAFFDAGIGLGAPLAGAVVALTSFEGAFMLGAVMAIIGGVSIALSRGRLGPPLYSEP